MTKRKNARRIEGPVHPDRLVMLFDTTSPPPIPPGTPIEVSCFAAAHREARVLVGRDAETGRLVSASHGGTWAGALVYLIFTEQIGSCFCPMEPARYPRSGHAVEDALEWFGGFSPSDSRVLAKLRDRLAHDYTLRAASHGTGDPLTFVLTGSAQEPVVSFVGDDVVVNLPALAIRVEQLALEVLLAADQGRLGCHHQGGFAAVEERFRMAVISG